MNRGSILAFTLLVLTLAACSGTTMPASDAQKDTSSPEPSVNESPLSPPPTPAPPEHTSPLPDPASSPIESPSGTTDQVVAAAKAHLADELEVASDDVEAVAIEPVDWPDASLGCPEPGQMYAQVVTPGYRITLEVDGKEYELHTDKAGRAIVTCER